MDIEKVFDALDHNFLISTLEKYGFGQNFILLLKLQSTFYFVEVPVKVTQFQRFCLF